MDQEKMDNQDQVSGAKPSETSTEKAKSMSDYFEIIGSKNRRFQTREGRYIDLRLGVPSDALELYILGKKWFGLKPGAEVLFSDFPKERIQTLIETAPRPKDVTILKKALK